MRKVSLAFSDVNTLTGFIFTCRIGGAEVVWGEQKLTAEPSEERIVAACTEYKAGLLPVYVF